MAKLWAGIFLLLTACESNEAKFARLNQDLLVAQFAVRHADSAEARNEPVCPELSNLPTNQYLRACSRKVEEQRAKLALAQREMNKFMAGR